MKTTLTLIILSIFITSCTPVVVRPKMIGVIVDEQGKPIENCKVGETFSDKNGKFELSEITQNEFFIRFGNAPVGVSEKIEKKGYEDKRLQARKNRGGVPVGTVWDMDTIRLRKSITYFSQIDLQDIWLASMTKKQDTLFMTKKNQKYDEGKIDIIANVQDTYSNGYYFGIDNLPENVFERHIELDLTDSIINIQRVLIYGNSQTSKKTKYDTLYTQGKWTREDQLFHFNTNLPELNGNYKVDTFNYDSMILIKQ
ncbi:hypothetical protein MG290_03115 [Flavobacterium sp. CBA20B-1]|uniref:hypothetical protein n=1 Tax=unclassified Flavobacterium TaxID=196869 RepID=UPI002224B022|nr:MULTISPECIES: hypothetical protein [unclassified Flavobacterium]WCM42683.1 hypothetical protein MG290_03115 [Flavobacterium sp. CBA20B-1]